MNEKLNTVFDIINATNTVSANRYLSHALGAEVAIIYNALLAKYAYYSKHDMIPDDWFYSPLMTYGEALHCPKRHRKEP